MKTLLLFAIFLALIIFLTGCITNNNITAPGKGSKALFAKGIEGDWNKAASKGQIHRKINSSIDAEVTGIKYKGESSRIKQIDSQDKTPKEVGTE